MPIATFHIVCLPGMVTLLSYCITVYRWPKNGTIFLYALTLPNINRFQNYFTVRIRRNFVIILSLKIRLHLQYVVTLPCEMSSVLKQQFLYALTASNINEFSKFYLLILLSVPSDVITDVIGIWSAFFESFVSL